MKNQETEKIQIGRYTVPCSYIAGFVIVLGCIFRIIMIGIVPGGINQDEAFAGYEAYSLLHYGKDSFGNAFPVYFVSWGSGMNTLESYLMIPFIAIFGCHTWVIRLPQMIVGCCSLVVFYQLMNKIFSKYFAVFGVFFLSICPWHILLSRWALESNLVPGFLLFGLYFFLLGVEKSKYFLVSAFCYGLSLYAYATIWPIIPIMLGLQLGYVLYTKKIKCDGYLIGAIGVIAVFAIPLFLFLMINKGYIGEIATEYFTIPKLPVIRESEISLRNIPENFKTMIAMEYTQNDGLCWNVAGDYGLYYRGMLLFGFFGFCILIKQLISGLRKREYHGSALIVVWFFAAFLLGCLIQVNVNRINSIHFPIIMMITVGIVTFIRLAVKEFRYVGYILCCMLLVFFGCFTKYYYTEYADNIAMVFQDGIEEAVDFAAEKAEGDCIYVANGISYSKILFCSQLDVNDYIETREYINYPAAYMDIKSCKGFSFGEEYVYGMTYIMPYSEEAEEQFQQMEEIQWKRFGTIAVVYHE